MLAIVVARRLRSTEVLETLAELFVTQGLPAHIRSDNGPEFTATRIRLWLDALQVQTLFIEPGSPWRTATWNRSTGTARRTARPRDLLHVDGSQDLDRTMASRVQTVRPHSARGLSATGSGSPQPAPLSGLIMSPALS